MLKRLKTLIKTWRALPGQVRELYTWVNHDRGQNDLAYTQLNRQLTELAAKINERTTVHADVHMQSESTVIVIGRYYGHDYVRAFNFPAKDLAGLIDYLNQTEHGARLGRFDTPGGLNVKAVYSRDRL